MVDDEQLMLRFQDGSSDAFAELFDRFRKPVHGFFRRRLTDAARAEELMQETFLAILRGVHRYEVRATFRTYLYSIATKILWAERRRTPPDTVNAGESSEPRSRGRDPVLALWVREALDRIDPDYREALMLREYDQLSYEEIAQVLDVPINTVRSRLFRARLEMKALLDGKRQPAEARAS
jgi:RNA polymerase sigma-70 factor, ECF subfamily